MNLKLRNICLSLVFLPILASGQTGGKSFIEQAEKKDTVSVTDRLYYGAVIDSLEKGAVAHFPELQVQGLDFVGEWILDTLSINTPEPQGPVTYRLKASLPFTAFDEGTYRLPDFRVIVRDPAGERLDTLSFEGMEQEFLEIPIDTATFRMHGFKGEPLSLPEPEKERNWVMILLIVLGVLLIAGLVVFLVLYERRRKTVAAARKDPAYIVALRSLEGFRGLDVSDHRKQKSFYSGVTDALRLYISDTYGVSAQEMTTAEIFAQLKGKDIPVEMQTELKQLFERADFVKFAKYFASEIENAGTLPLAIRFVTETSQREMAREAEETKEK